MLDHTKNNIRLTLNEIENKIIRKNSIINKYGTKSYSTFEITFNNYNVFNHLIGFSNEYIEHINTIYEKYHKINLAPLPSSRHLKNL